MALDWNTPDLMYLREQFKAGRVILFAGAGFSLGATNKRGIPLPLGGKLGEILASEAKLPFNNESLPLVYEAVEPKLGSNRLWQLLQELYTPTACEEWYRTVMSLTWYRIYTTNIDDLFHFLIPFPSGQRLSAYVRGGFVDERDPHFEHLQCMHLHGQINHRASGLTFTLPEMASHTARPDTAYQNLASDMDSYPVVFIGSQLEEPILTHYLEMREQRALGSNSREWRPKSFLVSPTIGAIRTPALLRRNIIALECTGKEFFESFAAVDGVDDFTVKSVQQHVWPHIFGPKAKAATDVTAYFDPIVPESLPLPKVTTTSRFFLGADPTWDDILKRRDGDRQVAADLEKQLREPQEDRRTFVLHGPAGSGKTTCMMRVAYNLAAAGELVLFSRSTTRLDIGGVLALAAQQ